MGKTTVEGRFQIGKNGINPGVINSLNLQLKTRNRIRVSFLKSSGRDKETIKQMADEIAEKVDYKCYYRMIGFTIVVKKSGLKKEHKNKRVG